MQKFIVTVLICLLTSSISFGQSDPAYQKKLQKMFEVSGSEQTYKVAIQQMFQMFKQQKANVPENVWTEFEGEFLKTSIKDLVTMLEPVYQKHLTIDELQKIIEFYDTPTGKKFAEKTPFIMQESMQIGQQWGMKIGQEFQEKMKAKGY
ncbi:hypothetical protein DYBT9275_01953 [Dyadobacter sp. CECT 9275]|uniref:DUF2059 domain-containing protein n=1 Tax=Dyadobacter helix TaxID=2822344 RepID=A0A916NBW7_9BACT|nr:DUF2059 domain-containing protein [Dyadobacter sp. CECT 9275]CAG4998204.1 hypothetical protein DYBT9275_01953 [Dyadobacter sp. CECT 9275]